MEQRTEIWLVWDSDQIVQGVHPLAGCSGPCVVHRPTGHWMREFPLGYDAEKSCFYRSCKHGVHHQDPDDRTKWTNVLAKSTGKRPGKLRETAQAKLEQWNCPECSCGCCSLVRI